MARVIDVVVSPTGAATVQTGGYAGPDCVQASRLLEQALGTATAERLTAEFLEALTARSKPSNRSAVAIDVEQAPVAI